MNEASSELAFALKDLKHLLQWCLLRGWEPSSTAPPLPDWKDMADAVHLVAPQASLAPRVLLVWHPDLREGSFHGQKLRLLQRRANHYRALLRATDPTSAPALCLVGCPDFLVAFPLDGDPFSRRMRFSPARLQQGSTLLGHYQGFTAGDLARNAAEQAEPTSGQTSSGFLARLRKAADEPRWDWTRVFVGAKLDTGFVAFMGAQRRRIVSLILTPANHQALLWPTWRCLRDGGGPDQVPLASLVKNPAFRSGLIAAVDTVLLRLVLYRYLEAQYGYSELQGDEAHIALGSYDDLLRQSTRVDRGALLEAIRRSHKGYVPADGQLGLFAPTLKAVDVHDPGLLRHGLRERAERYQAAAGGDLHQGRVAEAADVLQRHLLEHHEDMLALLVAGTSPEDYSFHYADLDPRAFQDFYQDTIGTDIRLSYDPQRGTAEVGVVEEQRNRKEQGAYYTDEKLCGWLVERTLGVRFHAWDLRLQAAAQEASADRPARVRTLLAELFGWKILDPTCGGGIFLRAAFEFLSRQRERITDLLDPLPSAERAAITGEAPYDVFGVDAETGQWEWYVLLHMLHGIDVDVKAVNVASNLLTLSALSYKPQGVCFPSFVNVSLKHGNALVVPLRPEERADFAAAHGGELSRLIALRDRLRDPALARGEWKALHAQAEAIARTLRQARIVLAYRDLFPGLSQDALIERVMRVGVFLYEVEFPEVFFDVVPDGRNKRSDGKRAVPRENPGFDFILGNPPWEEPAAELKQFLPPFDPEYLQLKGSAAKAREVELLADHEIAARWSLFQESVEDYKRLLTSRWYQHQKRKIKGKFPGAHSNLYKYATEMAWTLLREGGMAGIVTDGGLWQDLASSGLRALLLDQSETEAVCGFTNNDGLFRDIHRSYKITVNVFRRGLRTQSLPVVFMRRDIGDLDAFDDLAASIPTDEIRSDPRDSYPVPEIREAAQWRSERALSSHPVLEAPPWAIDTYSRELNAGEQREYFLVEPQAGYLPLVQGAQFNLFGLREAELPNRWIDPSDAGAGGFLLGKQRVRILDAIAGWLEAQHGKIKGGKREAALAWIKDLTGGEDVPAEWMRLDLDGYRLAWRDVARNDDKRSLICAVLPPMVGLTHTAPFVRPFRLEVHEGGVRWSLQYPHETLLYLAGMLSSFVADSIVRTRLAKTHLTSTTFNALHVPSWADSPDQRRIADLTARLTCVVDPLRPWADYTELAASVGLVPARDGLTDPAARREAQVELNAIAAKLYGLERADFRYLMDLLFMTPEHREEHTAVRDAVLERMEADTSANGGA